MGMAHGILAIDNIWVEFAGSTLILWSLAEAIFFICIFGHQIRVKALSVILAMIPIFDDSFFKGQRNVESRQRLKKGTKSRVPAKLKVKCLISWQAKIMFENQHNQYALICMASFHHGHDSFFRKRSA